MGAKDSRSSRYDANNYPHNMPTITPTYNTPHTPRELRCAIPFRLRSRELLPQFSHPCPSRYGCVEMGPMEPALDGTQLGRYRGSIGGRRWD
jgi:hypothetical protein